MQFLSKTVILKILQIDRRGVTVNIWDTPGEAAKALNLDPSHIIKCIKGRRSKHGGYRWVLEDEPDKSEPVSEGFKSYDYQGDSAILTAKTEKSITSLEEAIAFFEIDINKWEVERFVINSWDVSGAIGKKTNYQVKVWLKPKQVTLDEVSDDLLHALESYIPKPLNITRGSGIITVELADFHIGADVRDLLRTPDFNIGILEDYLRTIVNVVNSYGAERVVVNFHGDFIESITGLNHDDTWKSIGPGMYGAKVIILANELLANSLLSGINNLSEINIVAGNHDRMSAKNTVDTYGEAARLLAWLFTKDFPGIVINYDKLILVRKIDGINHIMTHGQHGISKRDVSKIVADYGDSKLFNLWTEGHLHTRTYTKVLKSKLAEYSTIEYVSMDEQKYRKMVLPPIFTGNFYSESLGYAGYAGFAITFNNGKGIPNIHDYTL